MSWSFLDVLEGALSILELFGSKSAPEGKSLNYDESVQKKSSVRSKYFTEKASAGFILVSVVLFFIAFHRPFRPEDQMQAIMGASLIGVIISALFFFVLHVMELYYFKSAFQWLLFSCSVIVFSIALVLCIYYKSEVFI
ncbi:MULTISPECIES: hypothetical protein [Chryseobacterium]|uniref:hypothetical protein n=1 Tax=Chryseobacterium TaxID=59732 RepID=UPI000488614D|nr:MULTISPECIES: hypothetical protein [Chryseobacterium]